MPLYCVPKVIDVEIFCARTHGPGPIRLLFLLLAIPSQATKSVKIFYCPSTLHSYFVHNWYKERISSLQGREDLLGAVLTVRLVAARSNLKIGCCSGWSPRSIILEVSNHLDQIAIKWRSA